MYLKLNHQKLDIYGVSRQFVFECYRLTKNLPSEEKFGMITQIRRAALSVHLNIAEGSSRKSEIDAALDIAIDLDYINELKTEVLGETMVRCFKLLTGLIESKTKI